MLKVSYPQAPGAHDTQCRHAAAQSGKLTDQESRLLTQIESLLEKLLRSFRGGQSTSTSARNNHGDDLNRASQPTTKDVQVVPSARSRFATQDARDARQAPIKAPVSTSQKRDIQAHSPVSATAKLAVSASLATQQPTKADTVSDARVSKPTAGQQPPDPTGVVNVDKPIVVHAGETFDGKGQYFKPTLALGDGGTSETQKPVFIVENGGALKNVQYSGADGIHLMGDAKLDNVVNRDVGEDAITIDGKENRQADAAMAGLKATDLGRAANIEITNSSFYKAHDKVIQTNGDANVKLRGLYAEDIGQLMVTRGGYALTAHVDVDDATLRGVKYDAFRFDADSSTLNIRNTDTGNAPLDAMMGNTNNVSGAKSVRQSIDTVHVANRAAAPAA